MSGQCCVTAATRRVRRSAPWVAPAAVLLLAPKCPMCLAAYVMAATGVSVSISTVGWVRLAMIGGSAAALLGLAAGFVRRCWRGKRCPCARASHT